VELTQFDARVLVRVLTQAFTRERNRAFPAFHRRLKTPRFDRVGTVVSRLFWKLKIDRTIVCGSIRPTWAGARRTMGTERMGTEQMGTVRVSPPEKVRRSVPGASEKISNKTQVLGQKDEIRQGLPGKAVVWKMNAAYRNPCKHTGGQLDTHDHRDLG